MLKPSWFLLQGKAVHSSPINSQALKCPYLNLRNPSLRSPRVFLSVKNIHPNPSTVQVPWHRGSVLSCCYFAYTWWLCCCPQHWSHEVHLIWGSVFQREGGTGVSHTCFSVSVSLLSAVWDHVGSTWCCCQSAAGSTATTKRQILL